MSADPRGSAACPLSACHVRRDEVVEVNGKCPACGNPISWHPVFAAADSYVMANANRCTVHPQHVMVNQGRSDAHFADLYVCACGEQRIGNTDEVKERAVSGRLLAVLRSDLGF